MEAPESSDLEELMSCGYCKQKFNDTEFSPKLLSCKHYFCLKCTRNNLVKGQELLCVYCWKRTELDELGPESLPTYTPILSLTKNFYKLNLSTDKNLQQQKQQQQQQQSPLASKINSETCHIHAMPLILWCHSCFLSICRVCASTVDHGNHKVKSHVEAKEQLVGEMQIDLTSMNKILSEIQRLSSQQREFLLKILEACVTLKTHIETDLTNNLSHMEIGETRDHLVKLRLNLSMAENLSDVCNIYSNVNMEKQRLQSRYHDMYLQSQLDDLTRNSSVIFDFQLLKQALNNIHNGGDSLLPISNGRNGEQNPTLFLANYCMAQLFSRYVLAKQQQQPVNGLLDYQNHNVVPPVNYLHIQTPQQQQPPLPPAKNIYQDNNLFMPPPTQQQHQHQHQPILSSPQIRNISNICPLYYFNIEVNGTPMGRIIIEVRNDVAPKMAKNFDILTTGEAGIGYKGCQIFQCWDGESVITGDFELNNGRGGRSVFEESYFLPDDTKLLASRGTVGMRRTQKRHDNLGMVGSQFRIILQEMRGFTGIFGYVVEGLELIEKISKLGDSAGKPSKSILIAKCGKL